MHLSVLFDNSRQYYENKLDRKYPDLKSIMENKEPVIIYGAARMGRLFKKHLKNQQILVIAFSDKDARLWETTIDGISVISPDKLQTNYAYTPIFVASLLHETPICDKLDRMNLERVYPLFYLNLKYPDIFISPEYRGVFDSVFNAENRRKIRNVMGLWEDDISRTVFSCLIEFRFTFQKDLLKAAKSRYPQYFEPSIISLSDEEVMLDCGAYIGDTVKQFDEITFGRYKKVYSLEPDRYNFIELQQCANNICPSKIIPVNCGVYRTSGELYFSETGTIDTHVTKDENASKLPVVSIDEFVRDKESPTFIKMDIEGGEMDALEGGRNTISKHKPKLAIAVYHKAEDIWDIPLLIRKVNPEYKMYLRHYTNELIDTVCYAV